MVWTLLAPPGTFAPSLLQDFARQYNSTAASPALRRRFPRLDDIGLARVAALDSGWHDIILERDARRREGLVRKALETSIEGMVDKHNQRAAWTVGKKKSPVFEAGIANLTREETTVLVHFGKGKIQQMTLVRIEEPKEGEADQP